MPFQPLLNNIFTLYIPSDIDTRMIAAASTQLKSFTRVPSARVARRSAHVCAAARPTWYPGMIYYYK